MIIITLAMTLIVLAVTLLSCVSDVRSLRIPNWHVLVIIACFIPAWLATPELFGGLTSHLVAMGLMLVITYVMFSLKMMGGGDSKLGTALGLWIGLKGFLPFMLYMAIMGGVLGVITVLIEQKKPFKNPRHGSWVEQTQTGHNVVPYGIAISFGAWAAFLYTGLIHNQLNEVFKIIH